MDEKRAFYQVQFPLAFPYIMGGIKMAASEVIASAALAAYIGSGGLGVLIYNGISLMKTEYLVIGGGSVAALTLVCNLDPWRDREEIFVSVVSVYSAVVL